MSTEPASAMAARPDALARRDALKRIRGALNDSLIGHDVLVERLLIALLTGGHVLLEGPPGVAKTRAINHFARLLDVQFVRIQGTPDLLPADITGSDMYHQSSSEFRFLPGPLFSQIVLFDEINRAPPKVQSALLEAMGESQITTGGTSRPLLEPFLVAATQNPLEHEGTYPLPEAQLDRFLFFLELALPDVEDERLILDQVLDELGNEDGALQPLADASLVMLARGDVRDVYLSSAVRDYIVRLVGATRGHGAGGEAADAVVQAASPRGSINLATAAQARAWLDARDHVTPDDVHALAPDVLSGRIALDYGTRASGVTQRQIVTRILQATPRV